MLYWLNKLFHRHQWQEIRSRYITVTTRYDWGFTGHETHVGSVEKCQTCGAERGWLHNQRGGRRKVHPTFI